MNLHKLYPKIRTMIVSFFFACIICMVSPLSGFAADSDKFVSVEAEGHGETKMQAMRAAWMEAVRLGIGMYLDARTTVIDDAITDEIVAHSRGRVDSFEELSSEKTDDGWRVRIRAKIEKDVLKETAASAQSQKVTINPNLAAQAITEREKKLSGIELLAAYQMPPWEKFFNLKIEVDQKDGQYLGKFSFRVNMDMYRKVFVEDFVKILDQIAINKKEARFEGKVSESLKAIRAGKGDPRLLANADGVFSYIDDKFSGRGRFAGQDRGRSAEESAIYIIINDSMYIQYTVSKEIAAEFATKVGIKTTLYALFSDIDFIIDIMEKSNIIDSIV